ncbi:hypothetical protein OF83DRAFT_1088812 [Amylostereum chailletii]|nr:hypothetical protein OF83DRAFT_1088812 [Amylostereum chailletii]
MADVPMDPEGPLFFLDRLMNDIRHSTCHVVCDDPRACTTTARQNSNQTFDWAIANFTMTFGVELHEDCRIREERIRRGRKEAEHEASAYQKDAKRVHIAELESEDVPSQKCCRGNADTDIVVAAGGEGDEPKINGIGPPAKHSLDPQHGVKYIVALETKGERPPGIRINNEFLMDALQFNTSSSDLHIATQLAAHGMSIEAIEHVRPSARRYLTDVFAQGNHVTSACKPTIYSQFMALTDLHEGTLVAPPPLPPSWLMPSYLAIRLRKKNENQLGMGLPAVTLDHGAPANMIDVDVVPSGSSILAASTSTTTVHPAAPLISTNAMVSSSNTSGHI